MLLIAFECFGLGRDSKLLVVRKSLMYWKSVNTLIWLISMKKSNNSQDLLKRNLFTQVRGIRTKIDLIVQIKVSCSACFVHQREQIIIVVILIGFSVETHLSDDPADFSVAFPVHVRSKVELNGAALLGFRAGSEIWVFLSQQNQFVWNSVKPVYTWGPKKGSLFRRF